MKIPIISILKLAPLRAVNPDEVRKLADKMLVEGQTDAIIVRQRPQDHYELIDGLHRLEAAKLLGWIELEANLYRGPS